MGLIFAIFPVLILIIFLIILDSFKIINYRNVIIFFVLGILVSLAAYFSNNFLIDFFLVTNPNLVKFYAPIIEEILKFLVIFYVIRKSYSAFLGDTAIYGFIIGGGFAFAENLFYFFNLESTNIMLSILRGLGTAIMHGSMVALSAVIYLYFVEIKNRNKYIFILVAIIPSIIIHSAYNHFWLPPIIQTVIILLVFGITFLILLNKNEELINQWLENELDEEFEIVQLFEEGKIIETNIGKYINKIKARFDPYIVFDMLVLLKLNIELSMQFKVNMMLIKNEIEIPKDDEFSLKIADYHKLKKNIGKSAMNALNPIISRTNIDKWKSKNFVK